MKALSVHQPWAWALLHAGKDVENRTWETRYRGPLAIHASKTRDSYDAQNAAAWLTLFGVELPAWEDLATGAIVGVVDLVDCVQVPVGVPGYVPGRGKSPWAQGPWLWVVENPRPLAKPVPYRGAQGLFNVPDKLVA